MILTSDAASILKELDVVHPAAKLIVMAAQQQESEMGDATNMVIVFAGELLKRAEELLRMGLKTSDIVLGYEIAEREALKVLDRTLHSYIRFLRKYLDYYVQASSSTTSTISTPQLPSKKLSVLSSPPSSLLLPISLPHSSPKPSSLSFLKTLSTSTSTTSALSRLWAAASPNPKSSVAWFLAASLTPP